MKFRKKPVIVEAMQFNGCNEMDIACDLMKDKMPEGLRTNSKGLVIPTLEGDMQAVPGDWIIKGVQGEFYPCKPDIFEQTYEPA